MNLTSIINLEKTFRGVKLMMKKKKYLLTGIIAFFLIAIISTTFATFVITGGNKSTTVEDGNIGVGTIDSQIVNVSAKFLDGGNNIVYDADENDHDGDVQVSNYSGNYDAKLQVSVEGEEWTEITITVSLVEGDNSDNLIALPKDVTITKTQFGSAVENTYTKDVTLTFDWGTKFAGDSPSIWLDAKGQAATYTSPEAKRDALQGWLDQIATFKYKVDIVVK